MTQSLRTFTLLILVFCFVKPAEAQVTALTPDDTAAYVNATLHKFPTLEFVDSGCPGYEQVVMISSDRRSLIIKQSFGKSMDGKCDNVQTLTVPIFSLSRDEMGSWSKQGQHSSFVLNCINHVDCFSRQSEAHASASAENTWLLQVTAPDKISNRLTRAIQHLVESLLAEATLRIDSNDPFAKRSR